MEIAMFFVFSYLIGLGVSKAIDKIVNPIADRAARKEWNKIVLQNMKRQRREMWEEQLISIGKDFSRDDLRTAEPCMKIGFRKED